MKSTNFKICDVIIDITAYEKIHFWLFLLNPREYQIDIWSNIHAAYGGYSLLALGSTLKKKASSRLFHDFNKMTISWDLLIFSSYLLYLGGWFHTFKIVKNQKMIILGYWIPREESTTFPWNKKIPSIEAIVSEIKFLSGGNL